MTNEEWQKKAMAMLRASQEKTIKRMERNTLMIYNVIKDERILKIAKECTEKVQEWLKGYFWWSEEEAKKRVERLDGIDWRQHESKVLWGQANWNYKRISLNEVLFKADENSLRQTIYHELLHLAADKGDGHRGYWASWSRQMPKDLGLPFDLPRTSNKKGDEYLENERLKSLRYFFKAEGTDVVYAYRRKSKIVKNYQYYFYRDEDGKEHYFKPITREEYIRIRKSKA